MTASTTNSNNGAVEAFNPQSDNSKSFVSENLVINDSWKILSLYKLLAFKNTFVTISTTPLSYTLNSSSAPMTIAQRSTLTPIEGMIVDISDGSTRGVYRYTNGSWTVQ
ncbi:hypothetical protein EA772_10365 [Pedobacter sp. G11]|uniref:hypothetical protein n=1 Tax=Pedobacter sp. G11 TaxID=2482728 RepID=UPI000F5E1612|nr:hypothetical protein [Pedobacter sp. G11]AZI25725.1 hypothetical protein EA772_10365 [Pedobacter sp. G11]